MLKNLWFQLITYSKKNPILFIFLFIVFVFVFSITISSVAFTINEIISSSRTLKKYAENNKSSEVYKKENKEIEKNEELETKKENEIKQKEAEKRRKIKTELQNNKIIVKNEVSLSLNSAVTKKAINSYGDPVKTRVIYFTVRNNGKTTVNDVQAILTIENVAYQPLKYLLLDVQAEIKPGHDITGYFYPCNVSSFEESSNCSEIINDPRLTWSEETISVTPKGSGTIVASNYFYDWTGQRITAYSQQTP